MSFVPTATVVLNQWVRILGALEKKINRQSFETWLKPTRFSRVVGKTLYVRIPNQDFEHIGDKYAQLIDEAIDQLELELESVVFETPAQDPATPKMREDGGFAPVPSHSANAPGNGNGNPRPGGLAGTHGGASAVGGVAGRMAQAPGRRHLRAIPLRLELRFAASTRATSSTALSPAPAISSRSRPPWPSPSGPRKPTTRSSSMAASAWAKRT